MEHGSSYGASAGVAGAHEEDALHDTRISIKRLGRQARPLRYTGAAMQKRDRPGEGDIRGPTKGDYSFTDWDNPEDEIEDAPEGDSEEEPEDEEPEVGPGDPGYDRAG